MVESKGLRGLSRRLTLYSLLVGGSVLFSIPFVWLLLSSFKTNEEQFLDPPRWMPRTPSAAVTSPYVARDEFPAIERPSACPRSRWDELRPALLDATRKAIADAKLPDTTGVGGTGVGGTGVPPVSSTGQRPVPPEASSTGQRPVPPLAEEVLEGVFSAASRGVADDVWFQSPETLLKAWAKQLTPNLIRSCRDKAYKRFLFGPLRVKSFQQEEEILSGTGVGGTGVPPVSTPTGRRPVPPPIASEWQVEGGSLAEQTAEGRPCALLSYQLAADEGRRAKLTGVFPLPFPVDRMKKLVLSFRSDHSWHALNLELEADGARWSSVEPFFTASDQWLEQTWQFPSDDDQSLKVKSWIVLREAGASDFKEPGKVRLTLTLQGRSRARSWLTKLWNNYRWAFRYMPFWRYTAVSAFLCLMTIIGQLTGSSLAAYAFARLRWPGREFCFMLLLGTLMIPGAVTMVPSFLIFKHLGWYNTLLVLWVPSFCGSAFNIFLLRQFMRGIPSDLEDAAKIDGCSFLGVYRHVILPSIGPALAAIAIFTFMGSWNNFMGPLIFLSDQSKYPLALGIFGLQTQAGGNFGLIMAASALMALPVVVMFFFCQRYFIQGITLTGMKN